MRRLWAWLTPRLKAAIGADLLYNATKSRGYFAKVAEDGAVLVLAQVVAALHHSDDPEDVQVVRRCAVSLCRLTRTNPSAQRVLVEKGVSALANVIDATVAMKRRSPAQLDTPSRRIGAKLIRAAALCRLASAAVSRLLWRQDSCLEAVRQGACQAVSQLTTSRDRCVCHSYAQPWLVFVVE